MSESECPFYVRKVQKIKLYYAATGILTQVMLLKAQIMLKKSFMISATDQPNITGGFKN
jgi:hypothetical protein